MTEVLKHGQAAGQLRWRLLATASATAVLVSLYGIESVSAADSELAGENPPLVWISFGGQFDQLIGGFEGVPIFLLPPEVGGNPLPISLGKEPAIGFDAGGKVTFEPENSDWLFSVSMRYGRAHQGPKTTHNQNYEPGYKYNIHANDAFVNTSTRTTESHAVFDFSAGKDVGLGAFGRNSASTISLGIRFAQFESRTNTHITYNLFTGVFFGGGNEYQIADSMSRSFTGIGPSISWDASVPVTGSPSEGISVDWGMNAAALFGRQKAILGSTDEKHASRSGISTSHGATEARSRNLIVPNIGGIAAISFRLSSAKLSFGYRADVFFDAIDGGLGARKSFDRGFYGPIATVGVGLP